MAKTAVSTIERVPSALAPERLIEMYRLMYLSRRTDDREIMLKRQQKIFFQISGAGHEALLVAAGMALRPGYDWFFPYYRDRALCLTLGVSVEDMLLQAVGAAADPSSGGRQMPSHWGSKKLNIVSQSSATATQVLHAVGCAEAGRYFSRHPEAAEKHQDDYRAWKDVSFHGDEVVYTSLGEGSTSQGEFWEALNTASNQKLPVLFVVEDNGYAISVPVEVNTPGGNISKLVANFPNFYFAEVDGTDPVESYLAFEKAVAHCRSGAGPAFVHGHVIRPYSHSLSDDDRLYRPKSELDADALRDPIHKLQMYLLREGILDAEAINRLEKQVDEEVRLAAERALRAPFPGPSSIPLYVYSENYDPTRPELQTRPAQTAESQERTMADLINACLRDEMRRDPRIVIFGEDVADCSREEYLKDGLVKGKGGVFKLTAGLQSEFGSDRVFNSPLAEANIVGRALGQAVRGLKPVVEIQFFDYIWPATHQMRNELSVLRWRSNNTFSAPAVVRVAIGGYLTGGAIYHSQCGESIFTHTPGIRVVFPSNALDANGLLRTAIRCDDPVLFLEHKRLYRETFGRAPYPGPDYMVPFGKAKIVREGTHLTLVTYGAVVPRALQAAQKAQREHGIETEVLDLRTLSPYDWEAIATSVKKTSRVIVAHEDMLSWGYGAEIAARIADELFEDLDAPVKRVAAMDTFVAYQPLLEDVILPQPERIYQAITELVRF
ncbi:alpha-ketoacid dehydrogenase subunit alpha/beta [Pseudacidobacterium ailaaui]|jgi:2-oxoisovalerate dehydrogenase E1 component|uniref:alpha-ketoacid dehydrogenase subunit alpha/beta n=1 Tax=Pseudacidobacterium ailaaui TaxID=1382359 RepID=UPI0005D1C404|nr:dehydrogenase E1 component subunit alpha/beta [Pseudacidobacterium ailaaui]MBX6360348.1 dehydrogenase E1 component subunit alpha/beta [Pseudacidobacterium ailaaui]MCL6462925.1 dehydrogenase E1 component subunit alpha/beta [Pseudacidobacterium ailaaui]MDI3254604.1 dehydrogenase E1 component subunit alpha/beta [Bacillota bacterium]